MNTQTYRDALKQIKRLSDNKQSNQKDLDNQTYKITWDYRDQIHEIERKRDNELATLKDKYAKIIKDIDEEIVPYSVIRDKTEKIFDMIDIYVDNIFLFLTPDKDLPLLINDIEDHEKEEYERRLKGLPKVYLNPIEQYKYSDYDEAGNYIGYNNRKIFISPIDVIVDNDFKKIHVYILENRKPKNKYDLKIVIKSVFKGIYARHGSISDSEITYKNTPDEKTLLDWYNRHKESIREEYSTLFDPLEQEYKEAVELFKIPEWQLAYMERKKYYYEHEYSRGVDTKEYKKVLEEIKRLKGIL